MSTLIVAGINGEWITSNLHALFEDKSCIVVCSKSHLRVVEEQFPGFSDERWIPIVPLEHCLETIEHIENGRTTLFLLSGDPLFFGLGKRLKQRFPTREIRFYPAVSYMQSCFARAGINWDDADFISLHGRPLETIDQKLNSKKLFIYTDTANSPDIIAAHLMSRLGDDASRYLLHIGERIGTEKQRFMSYSLEETARASFAQPNSMILVDTHGDGSKSDVRFGLCENDIEHSRGLITKSEVRAAVIHRLRLPDTGVFWDIGAGSGSIGIEAARLFPSLSVYAVERSDEQLANIRTNKSVYGCRNLHIIDGSAPENLVNLPRPDRVFIGGSGGRLEQIIAYLADKTCAPLHIVVTAVLQSTADDAPELLHARGYSVDVSIVKTSRYQYPAKELITYNPIHIICGTRS